jgi:hypothetical protein
VPAIDKVLAFVDFESMLTKNNPTRRRVNDQTIGDFDNGIHLQPGKMWRGDGGSGLYTPITTKFRQTGVSAVVVWISETYN